MAGDPVRLVLLRHGEAERMAARDELRVLTGHGRTEALASAQLLASLALPAPVVVSSPYLRAKETAEIIASVLGAGEVIAIAGITPDDDPRKALAMLDKACRQGMTVIAVTHMPLIGALLGLLVHGDARDAPGVPTAGGSLLEGDVLAAGLMRQRQVIHPGAHR